MKVHHYTTIETLALILKNKTIRFNRLDKVDDLEESEYGMSEANVKMGKYIFVSCWTRDDDENIALWGLYTQNKGVRITLDEDMFITYPVTDTHKSYFPAFMQTGKDYVIMCTNNDAKLIDIEYVNNLAQKVKEIGNYYLKPDGKEFSLNFDNSFGNFKSIHWEFQRECRYKIIAFPCIIPKESDLAKSNNDSLNLLNFFNSLTSSISPSLMSYQDISANYFDITLNENAFQNIEILLAPQSTVADKLIVEALINSYCPSAILKESNLKGKIRGKF